MKRTYSFLHRQYQVGFPNGPNEIIVVAVDTKSVSQMVQMELLFFLLMLMLLFFFNKRYSWHTDKPHIFPCRQAKNIWCDFIVPSVIFKQKMVYESEERRTLAIEAVPHWHASSQTSPGLTTDKGKQMRVDLIVSSSCRIPAGHLNYKRVLCQNSRGNSVVW